MKSNFINNINNSHNNFNPFSCTKKYNSQKINGNNSKIYKETQTLDKSFKKHSFKKQGINFNSSQISKTKKILKNNDINNDMYNTINCQENYSQKSIKIKNNIKKEEITQSRNINKFNHNSVSNTIMSSFSLSNDIVGYTKKSNRKKYYDLDGLKDNGIKYCFDEDGNPIDINDIKTKNKNPIAFIIQTAYKNILMDTNNQIISPNITGDYTLPHKPYIIIHKYDVLHPELRVIKSNNKDIDLNDDDNIIDFQTLGRRKKNKSTNFYNIDLKRLNGLNEINEDKEIRKDDFKFFSPKVQSKMELFKNLNNNIKNKKRKYIFVNRLSDFNKSVQINANKNMENENSLTKNNLELEIYDKTFKNYFTLPQNHFSTINNEENKSTYVNHLLSNYKNELKETKSFIQHRNIKDLEFKFERKYKSTNPLINQTQNANETDNKETPKKKTEVQLVDYFNSIPKNSSNTRPKKILIFNKNRGMKLEINKSKKHRFSNSLNEFILNPLLKPKQITRKLNNALNNWNTLSTFNQSLMTPNTAKTTYSTIQKAQNENENNKISTKKSEIKIPKSNQYYLKPKIKNSNLFHKRINTGNYNTQKNSKFLQIENEKNIINDNLKYITHFNLTEANFNTNKKIQESNSNSSVCKCPYCHTLFYN